MSGGENTILIDQPPGRRAWINKMYIGGRPVKIRGVVVSFLHLPEDEAVLEIHSHSDNATLGGVALNGLNAGNASSIQDVFGRRIVIDSREQADAELAESVMWAPGGASLELERIEILLRASPLKTAVCYEIRAKCFDDLRTGITVDISGTAPVRGLLEEFIARASPHIRELWTEGIGTRLRVYGRLNATRPAFEFETTGGRIYLEAQDGLMLRRCHALAGSYLCAEIEKRSPSSLKSRQVWHIVRIDPIRESDLRQ